MNWKLFFDDPEVWGAMFGFLAGVLSAVLCWCGSALIDDKNEEDKKK